MARQDGQDQNLGIYLFKYLRGQERHSHLNFRMDGQDTPLQSPQAEELFGIHRPSDCH